jgi:hypothetical protein
MNGKVWMSTSMRWPSISNMRLLTTILTALTLCLLADQIVLLKTVQRLVTTLTGSSDVRMMHMRCH